MLWQIVGIMFVFLYEPKGAPVGFCRFVLTSDPDDIEPLAKASGLHVDIVPV
jgi:hypothetical protein